MIATSIEQSKELEKILPIDSADMFYDPFEKDKAKPQILYRKLYKNDIVIPAWSLEALLGLMPAHVKHYGLVIEKYDGVWDITYEGCGRDYDIEYLKNIESAELIDAAFEMIVWLKENSKI